MDFEVGEDQRQGEGRSVDVMEIHRSDDLGDITNLSLALDETNRLLAALQQEIVAAQVRDHAVRRPTCSRRGGGCRVKDYQTTWWRRYSAGSRYCFPCFAVIACFGSEFRASTGRRIVGRRRNWIGYRRHVAALMMYRTAADLLEQMFPVDAAG